jgi:hypothetical protein
MTEKQERRKAIPDRARKRAIRAEAARTGVAYSVAARQYEDARCRVDPANWAAGETLASQGRTVYPASTDTHRQWLIDCRARWSASQRVQDARRAADLPGGRALHLADRFPPTRGEDGTGVGLLYHGDGRQDALALLYTVIAHERPDLLPSTGDLAWEAEMGEETAVDTACAKLDRAARLLLDGDRTSLWTRVDTALEAAQSHHDWRVSDEAIRLAAGFRAHSPSIGLSLEGTRQILDAVLVVGDDGHAPGTRVRMLAEPYPAGTATIVGAVWAATGPPIRYEVNPDATPPPILADPHDLVMLATPTPPPAS